MSRASSIPTLQWKSIHAAKWNIAGQFAVQLLNVGGTILLSRWLPPAAVGLLLMLSLVSNFAAIIMNHAIGSAVIQHAALDNKDLSSLFWAIAGVAAIFYLLLIISAPLIAYFYREDSIQKFLPFFGSIFFFYALGCVSQALLAKKHLFRDIVLGNIAGLIISFSVAIFMIWHGYGAESLIAQLLLNTLISSLYFFLAEKWKPSFQFSLSSIKKVRRFIGQLATHSGLEYIVFNLDNFLVGRYFGNTGLGLYGRARQWVFLPVQNIAFAISRSFFPSFAQLKAEKAGLQEMYLFSFRLTFFLTTVVLSYMIVFSHELVQIFLGHQWLEIVPLFIWFSLTGIIGTVNGFNDSFITSQGQTGILLRTGMIEKILTITGIFVGLIFGLQGLVIARLVTSVIVLFPKTRALLRVSGIEFKTWINAVIPTFIICGSLIATGILANWLMVEANVILRLIAASTIFLVLLIVFSLTFKEEAFYYMRDVILRKPKQVTSVEETNA